MSTKELSVVSPSNNTNIIPAQPTYPTSWSAVAYVVAGIALIALGIVLGIKVTTPLIYCPFPLAIFCFLQAEKAQNALRAAINFEFAQKCLQAGFQDKAVIWFKTASLRNHPESFLELGKLEFADHSIFTSDDQLDRALGLFAQAEYHAKSASTKAEAKKLIGSVSDVQKHRRHWDLVAWNLADSTPSTASLVAESAAKHLQEIVEYYKPSEQPGADAASEGFTRKYFVTALKLINCHTKKNIQHLLFAAAKLNLPSVIKLLVAPLGTKQETVTHIDQTGTTMVDINCIDQKEDFILCSKDANESFEKMMSEREEFLKVSQVKPRQEKEKAFMKSWHERYPQQHTSSNHTPLMYALWHSKIDAAKTLIELKADLDVKDRLNGSVRKLLAADDNVLMAYCSCFMSIGRKAQSEKVAQLKSALNAIRPLIEFSS